MSGGLSPVIAIHLAAALTALVLGAIVLWRPKGTRSHKALGRMWLGAMMVTAIGSFWIRSGGSFSWIHALSAWTLIAIGMAFWQIRRGRVPAHRGWMIGAYTGLAVAGLFTLLPDRLLGQTVRAWLG